jgi:hypothetical protein
MNDQWNQLPELFHDLLELESADRVARLREVRSRDRALCARLEAMLGADRAGAAELRAYEAAAARSILRAMESGTGRDPLALTGILQRLATRFADSGAPPTAARETLKAPHGREDYVTQTALRRLVRLYEAWDLPDDAARVRARLTDRES